jgi:leucyl aminopeptidase
MIGAAGRSVLRAAARERAADRGSVSRVTSAAAATAVQASTRGPFETGVEAVAIGVFEGEDVAHDTDDSALAALLASGEARREIGRVAVAHVRGTRAVLVGLGPREHFDPERARTAAAAALRRARDLGARSLCWEAPHRLDDATIGGLVEGTLLRDYRFERYRKHSPGTGGRLDALLISAHHDVSAAVARAAVLASAQNRARDLGNTPANDLTPAALADYAVAAAKRLKGLSASVLEARQIREAGMGAFAAVARGSSEEPRLIRLEYRGGATETLGLVGKAITFDTGGISLKPGAKMWEMKFDMLGGAAVIEAICAMAELRLPVHVLGVVGAAENMPGGRATRPGDIVTALDGTTVEINNTDAEGRLVLADCITYARREGARRLVDLATLTGGVVAALGSVYNGLVASDDAWADAVLRSAAATGEIAWRLPLHESYAEMVKGRYADLTNSTERREATAITAAEFLRHFAGDTPWVHLDIAGTAYDVKRPYFADKGATGVGVRLLVDLAERFAQGT